MVALASMRVGFSLGMLISFSLYIFCSYWVPNAIAVSGGIWAKHVHL